MASAKKIGRVEAESEMEEGEIVDDLDDLSDISSEEEFLLRQRLEVLENYNNVLERKKKKRTSGPKLLHDLSCDLSEISAAEIDEPKLCSTKHTDKTARHIKQYSKQRRRKELNYRNVEDINIKRKRDHRKKTSHTRKKPVCKVINESSDESEDEYTNKRQKLAVAVKGYRNKSDTSTLSARLKKMLHQSEESVPIDSDIFNLHQTKNNLMHAQHLLPNLENVNKEGCREIKNNTPRETGVQNPKLCEPIDLLSSDDGDDDDDDVKLITNDDRQLCMLNNMIEQKQSANEHETHREDKDSDEDLAELRKQVLSTKTLKAKITPDAELETKIPSEDEDSDTTELRLICLKSSLLKRAIEMKQKQKMQKRFSQSTLEDDILHENIILPSKIDSGNNTDIESMDMDMESDTEERVKGQRKSETNTRLNENQNHNSAIQNVNTNKEDELEEDEDLLRAKLLTSLSKNLPNLVSTGILNTIEETKITESTVKKAKAAKVPEEKRFIIKLDESDSEGEHEATKNLTKMHMKLSEQPDFQQQLDLFLKSTRMAVENLEFPDVGQNPLFPKKPEKFVAKAVNHLPKSEQIEYKNLVKRMAELEKMKQSRLVNIASQQPNDTLKPRNATDMNDINLEERISISRKKIADESAKMLKLKEEATKLSQKYKIVATELHNISTAITLNKKQQRVVQNCLAKIRQQHQLLLKSSSTSLRSKVNNHFNNFTRKVSSFTKLQKENNPRNDYKNPLVQKTVKVSVVNDVNHENKSMNPSISVQINVANNQKVVKMPGPLEDRVVEITTSTENEKNNRIQTEAEEVTKTAQIEAIDQSDKVVKISENIDKEKNRLDMVNDVAESTVTEFMGSLEQVAEVTTKIEKVVINRLDRITDVIESTENEVMDRKEQYEANKKDIMDRLDGQNPATEESSRNGFRDCEREKAKDCDSKIFAVKDYKSPLDAFATAPWESDPNAILCPFEVGGQCKDPDCKYLHTKLSKQ